MYSKDFFENGEIEVRRPMHSGYACLQGRGHTSFLRGVLL